MSRASKATYRSRWRSFSRIMQQGFWTKTRGFLGRGGKEEAYALEQCGLEAGCGNGPVVCFLGALSDWYRIATGRGRWEDVVTAQGDEVKMFILGDEASITHPPTTVLEWFGLSEDDVSFIICNNDDPEGPASAALKTKNAEGWPTHDGLLKAVTLRCFPELAKD